MQLRIVVVGTDTGVGKTFVACALLRALDGLGHALLALKPVETGCPAEPTPDEDGALLAAATGQLAPRSALVRFRTPVAPPEAADREGRPLEYAALVAQVRQLGQSADLLLVETAGGLLSPLTWQNTALDLARDLGAQVLLVGSDRLGTLSHIRAALEILGTAGLPVLAVVLSAPAEPDLSTGSNQEALRKCGVIQPVSRLARDADLVQARASLSDLVKKIDDHLRG